MTKQDTDRCGAVHPESVDLAAEDDVEPRQTLVCKLPLGTNAYNDELDANVHVHLAKHDDGRVFRWEDVDESKGRVVAVVGDRGEE